MDKFITQAVQEGTKSNKLRSSIFFSKNDDSFITNEEQARNEINTEGLTDAHDQLDGASLIHLNIKGSHYYITKDQLMSLSESILLYMFPHGVFLDKDGDVITSLTANDEIYIDNFSPSCFEYIMSVFMKAFDNYTNFSFDKYYNIQKMNNSPLSSIAKGLFGKHGNNTANGLVSNGHAHNRETEKEILHECPTIIVLKEDLDYYCVPQVDLAFAEGLDLKAQNKLHGEFMHKVKSAAGSYLLSEDGVFAGLMSSNRIKYKDRFEQRDNRRDKKHSNLSRSRSPQKKKDDAGNVERHLMDMLLSSGFKEDSRWGSRTADDVKTVIESISLVRLYNETTDEFREEYDKKMKEWEEERKKRLSEQQQQVQSPSNGNVESMRNSPTGSRNMSGILPRPQLTTSMSFNTVSINDPKGNTPNGKTKTNKAIISQSTSTTTLKSSAQETNNTENYTEDADLTPPTIAGSASGSNTQGRKSRFLRFTDSMRSRSSSRHASKTRTDNSLSLTEKPTLYELMAKPDINYKLLLFWKKPARKCWWSETELELEIELTASAQDTPEDRQNLTLLLHDTNDSGINPSTIKVPIKLHTRRVWMLELSVIGASDFYR
ncbi:hypothetical protein TPHA_0J01210 [Tetrapisispora phaffii CBS 4417]|uniref:Uncharacterized protein n=1 Tax=Tetrapisispora phaffii (strain ATCC 24235 / CBS 4417 / NBRC 1672 / NRRL Y-8282 / UCD 70-5) TaxID=1071381 RepID=G8BYK1_TETPH|nr:hypothetical protein TPHA_0J01210 [Tetrapisispora phaffii CBS 4417]CCE64943.1 hypothetical protein TPHA_0J01210 [Tetrapisispora phaffii CBS 4417]